MYSCTHIKTNILRRRDVVMNVQSCNGYLILKYRSIPSNTIVKPDNTGKNETMSQNTARLHD